MELVLTAGTIIGSVLGGVLAVKIDIAKLRTDVSWIRRGLEDHGDRISDLEKGSNH